jgi:hypothetical protein
MVFGDSSTLWSGLPVMRINSSADCNIVVDYYNSNGTLNNSVPWRINRRGWKDFYAQAGMTGYAEITSDQEISALTYGISKATIGDTMAIYNTVQR